MAGPGDVTLAWSFSIDSEPSGLAGGQIQVQDVASAGVFAGENISYAPGRFGQGDAAGAIAQGIDGQEMVADGDLRPVWFTGDIGSCPAADVMQQFGAESCRWRDVDGGPVAKVFRLFGNFRGLKIGYIK